MALASAMLFMAILSKTTKADVSTTLAVGRDRSAEEVAFQAEVVAFFLDAAELIGVPKSVAAIYGVVFASGEPLSFSDIEARIDFSKGSISQGVRVLREVGAIKAVHLADDRREFFTPDLEMKQLIRRFIEQRLERQLNAGRARLDRLQQGLDNLPRDSSEIMAKRLEKLGQWHDRTRALLPVARTFLGLGLF